jgi:hypothetical protein
MLIAFLDNAGEEEVKQQTITSAQWLSSCQAPPSKHKGPGIIQSGNPVIYQPGFNYPQSETFNILSGMFVPQK